MGRNTQYPALGRGMEGGEEWWREEERAMTYGVGEPSHGIGNDSDGENRECE